MDVKILEAYIDLDYSTRKIAELENLSQTNVRHWLKKYNLSTNKKQFNKKEYSCDCGETNPKMFYGTSKQKCSKCHNMRTIESGKNNRLFAVNHLGGCCKSCGYNKYTGALDIHHLDPNIKDKNFRSMRGWCKERILNEIKNCILLCRNCHAEFHSSHNDSNDVI